MSPVLGLDSLMLAAGLAAALLVPADAPQGAGFRGCDPTLFHQASCASVLPSGPRDGGTGPEESRPA